MSDEQDTQDKVDSNVQEDTNKLIAQRREKLSVLRENGNAFPNTYRRDSLCSELIAHYSGLTKEQLIAEPVRVKIAGRMMSKRIMGKNTFSHIQDMSGRIQLIVSRDSLPNSIFR